MVNSLGDKKDQAGGNVNQAYVKDGTYNLIVDWT
jgi:hypothetical protein